MRKTEDKVFGHFQTFDNATLTAIVTGDADAVKLASKTLADRGVNLEGEWVGFPEAERLHKERMRDRRAGMRRLRLAEADAETHT